MKLFGTAQPFIESHETSFRIGRLVANYEFYRALFKYSDFDEFHIFCPTFANCKLTEKRISQEDIPDERKAKIRIRHIGSLKRSIAENNYHVFHLGGWGFFFPGLIHLRNLYATKPFPVTGITHSLNDNQAPFHALKVCSAPILPFDSIVCTSNCGKEVIKRLFKATQANFGQMKLDYTGRLDVIPLGIDDNYRTIPDPHQSRRSLDIDDDSFVILSLGRLTPVKKMDYAPFLTAIKRFADKNKDKKITLIIAGGADNSEQKLITDLIKENHLEDITKLYINFEDSLKTTLYSAADVYAAPIDNVQETFGLSVVEAMAHECAVVVSDFNGYSELVDHGINGLKIPTFWANITEDFKGVSEIMNFPTYQLILCQSVVVDMDKMAASFQQLLDNPEKRRQMAQNARQKATENYFWSDVIKRYSCLWDQLSGQADSYDGPVERPQNPAEVDYWAIFSHYPSKTISPDGAITLSEYGTEVLRSGNVPLSYSDITAAIILPQLIAIALKIIDKVQISTEQFIASLQKHAAVSDSAAMYHLLWMAKYNLINISE